MKKIRKIDIIEVAKNLLVVLLGASILYFLITLPIGCKKQDEFLNAKPNVALSEPTTLDDFGLLLNEEILFNINDPSLGLIADGEFYVPDNKLKSAGTLTEKNAYIWADDVYQGESPQDWSAPFTEVYTANTVLDGLKSIHPSSADEQTRWNTYQGQALFFRAWAFFNLLQTFTSPYDSLTANSSLGIPLRLTSDLNAKSERATQSQCYEQIVNDVKEASSLLPDFPSFLTKPSKWAANSFLARIYLATSDYTNAIFYANASLEQDGMLSDYNIIGPPTTFFFTSGLNYFPEDIFHVTMGSYGIIGFNGEVVDSNLYALYDSTDLRQQLFFGSYNGQLRFRGSYDLINGTLFSGLAIDEMYLIRAECYARLGMITPALNDLNTLLLNRYIKGTFVNRTAVDAGDALSQILLERRKELAYRGLRWTDLRRLNKDPRFAVTLLRFALGASHSLPPNDPKYAFPIPDLEIQTSGIQQNPR